MNNIRDTQKKTIITDLRRMYDVRYEQSIYWATILLQHRAPAYLGSYFVLGHPSSGTNWLCNLISDYLDLPVFEHWRIKRVSFGAHIFHMHRFLSGAAYRSRTIYMHRDGRDALVSLFLKICKSPFEGRWRERIYHDTGMEVSAKLIVEQLPVFIEWHFTKSQPASINWRDHIRKSQINELQSIAFETLVRNPAKGLAAVLSQLGVAQIDDEKLRAAVAKNDIAKLRTAENAHQVRSGRAGEWRRYFSAESAGRFHKYAGAELIALGYEMDESWVEDSTADQATVQ